ncbi:MAG: rhomboid family intramembrane serine protease [Chitinophagales bacterium]
MYNSIPPVVKNLLIINGLLFLGTVVAEGFDISLIRILGLHSLQSEFFKPYQFITHMFMHGGFLHIFSNMFALWMFGSRLEMTWGSSRFLFYYFFTGLGAAALHSGVTYWDIEQQKAAGLAGQELYRLINIPTVGASGAVFGVLIGFGLLFPNTQLMLLFPPIPIKAKIFVFLYGAFELYAGFSSFSGGSNIAHFAHVGGMVFGFILIKYWQKKGNSFY